MEHIIKCVKVTIDLNIDIFVLSDHNIKDRL